MHLESNMEFLFEFQYKNMGLSYKGNIEQDWKQNEN